MSTKQQNTEEEVDLGSLFQIIGKGFSKIFNFIVNIFKGLFHILIIALLFFRKHALIIIISGVVLGAVGYFLDFNKEKVYESTMLVKPNFKSTKQLYGNIKFYNDLVLQEEDSLLMSTFNLSLTEAKSLKSFTIKPIKNENNIISGYNDLALSVDTLAIKNYTIDDYKKSFTEYDYQVHEIKIKSTQNKIFTKFDEIILSSVVNNDFFKKLKESENKNLNRSDALFKKNLKDADTLRKVYMKALLDEANKKTQGTSIDMGRGGSENKEIELFKTSRDLNSYLNKINLDKAEKSEIVNVISSFQKVGKKSGRLRDTKAFLLLAVGLLGAVVFLLLKEFNTYLNNYKK